jgi:spore germination cell wall hydrolase CwlJ-like protein
MNKTCNGVIAEPMDKKHEEVDVLARTIYGEARGEGLLGMEAIANTIINRLKVSKSKGGFWWGNDIISICKKPYQFSCWNSKDINKEKIEKVNSNDKLFATCLRISRKAIAGILKDNTRESTHYHNREIEPFWAVDKIPNMEIGNHLFYKLV